jgi:hypothetical protein
VGSVGGAFLGHKMGGGPLGTMGGMVAGAIGANMLDSKHDKYVSPLLIDPLTFLPSSSSHSARVHACQR